LNGLWAEMTILVHELPEGWRLPSIVNFTIQIAQVTSLSFLLGRWLAPKAFTYARANYIILAIGSVSCLLLSFFWNKTAFIFGEERSIGLYVLNFCLAVLGTNQFKNSKLINLLRPNIFFCLRRNLIDHVFALYRREFRQRVHYT
jgi:hypothetical protein